MSHTKPISIINTLADSMSDTVQRQQASTVTHINTQQELEKIHTTKTTRDHEDDSLMEQNRRRF